MLVGEFVINVIPINSCVRMDFKDVGGVSGDLGKYDTK